MKTMNRAIAAMCVGLVLAAIAAPAFARTKHYRHANPPPVVHSKINSGWGPPRTWDEIEVSVPSGGG
jgi:hypothetical protein